MRHRKSGRKLKRTASHRKATLSALTTALLRSKRIQTTIAKAKETRMVVEKIITRAKNAVAANDPAKSVHARREVSRYIKDREVVKELFIEIAPKVATRPGGYTRIIKLGRRHGDAAEIALIELVDFNVVAAKKEAIEKEAAAPKKKAKEKFAPGSTSLS
jgi:large subunit ribosomal protein L17